MDLDKFEGLNSLCVTLMGFMWSLMCYIFDREQRSKVLEEALLALGKHEQKMSHMEQNLRF